jgi:UDP:flavonoid glycosyltransferase YjiC (YdhE family)
MDDKVKRMNGITLTSPKDAEKLTKKCFIRSEISGPLPMQRIQEARQVGRKIIFISLGTVATSVYWEKSFGVHALANDVASKEEGRRSLSEYTGKEFCQQVWRTCFDAFGGDDAFLVIMTLGPMEDAPEGLPLTPANFLVRDAVPQIEVLRLCDAFVTHGGANGMHEALSLGVPMAVVPIFGDQPVNADTVARSGAGVSFRNPLSTLSTTSLRQL